jgi:hypothetical protein
MEKKMSLNFKEINFDNAVDEVDFMVPKYLEALEDLEKENRFENIPICLKNVVTYWDRLSVLFAEIKPYEAELPFDEIAQDSLQAELGVLEKVYLSLNLRIEFAENCWNDDLWIASEVILHRMDAVLELLQFKESSEDRQFIQEILKKNCAKQEKWLKGKAKAG